MTRAQALEEQIRAAFDRQSHRALRLAVDEFFPTFAPIERRNLATFLSNRMRAGDLRVMLDVALRTLSEHDAEHRSTMFVGLRNAVLADLLILFVIGVIWVIFVNR